MKNTKTRAKPKSEASSTPLTADDVQRMIDASLIRFEITHGQLSADDGARLLEALKTR